MHFVCIFGPPAVGKMTVGHELTLLTGYKLFHNHLTIEPFLGIFEFGSPSFNRLSSEFRRRVVEEALESELPGLIFTVVWGLELDDDRDFVARHVDLVEGARGQVSFVELAAPLEVRLARNRTALRLDHKRSHRDEELSNRVLHDLERHVLNTSPEGGPGGVPDPALEVLAGRPYVRLDNTDLSPADAAARIAHELGLAGRPGSSG